MEQPPTKELNLSARKADKFLIAIKNGASKSSTCLAVKATRRRCRREARTLIMHGDVSVLASTPNVFKSAANRHYCALLSDLLIVVVMASSS